MLKTIKYFYGAFLVLFMPIIGYSEDNSFYKEEPSCNDNEKILKIINKTKNEERVMCLEANHDLHKYINKNKGDHLEIDSN